MQTDEKNTNTNTCAHTYTHGSSITKVQSPRIFESRKKFE